MDAALMENARELEVLPPEPWMLILADPELEIRLDGTAAVSCVLETNVVVSALPFHST